MHPDCEIGRVFWNEVFLLNSKDNKRPKESYSTFQRVWLVPATTEVYTPEKGKAVYITKHHIKVMCEDDYLSKYSPENIYNSNEICTPIFKKIILPIIEEEVNKGKNFSRMIQIYKSLILAKFFKEEYCNNQSWAPYIDSGNPNQFIKSINNLEPLKGVMNWLENNQDKLNIINDKNEIDEKSQHKDYIQIAEDDQQKLHFAIQLRTENKLNESYKILKDLVVRNIRHHGKYADLTQKLMSQLGLTLRIMGKTSAALNLHQEVFDINHYIFGEHHPYTVDSMETLADSMEYNKEIGKAVKLRNEASSLRQQFSKAFEIKENWEFHSKYMKVFRDGVFNLVRKEFRHGKDQNISVMRSYFSGAVIFHSIPILISHIRQP